MRGGGSLKDRRGGKKGSFEEVVFQLRSPGGVGGSREEAKGGQSTGVEAPQV